MNLENTVRSEEARPTAPPTVWFNLYDMSRIGKSIDTKVDWWFPGAGEREEGEMTANGDGIFFFGMWWKYSKIDVVRVVQLCEYIKNH